MKYLLLLTLLASCSSQQKSPAPSDLNGLWQQTTIGCDNDPNFAYFDKERKAIAEGKSRNTLEIKDGNVQSRYWRHRFGDPKDKGHCTLVIDQEWKIRGNGYEVVKMSDPRFEDNEKGGCGRNYRNPPLTHLSRIFILKGDELQIFSPGSAIEKKTVPGNVLVCPGANLMVTFKRVK